MSQLAAFVRKSFNTINALIILLMLFLLMVVIFGIANLFKAKGYLPC